MIGEDREGEARRIPVARLRPRGFPARAGTGDSGLADLAASIRSHGLLHPILVRPAGRDFEVVCGQRRLDACRTLGWGEIPAVVRALDDRRAIETALAENARRAPLGEADRRTLLVLLAELYPGRHRGELEGWLGVPSAEPVQAVAAPPESLWAAPPEPATQPDAPPPIEPPPEVSSISVRDTSVIMARPDITLRRRSVVGRVRMLLQKLSRSGVLDPPLLRSAIDDILDDLDTQPGADFLDLRYPPKAKRWVSRHCVNVTKLAVWLARSLGMGRTELEDVAACGLLHDVGMMKVKDDVFTKHAALDQVEWEQVKGHPIEGSLLLTKEVVLRDVVARVALEHHERADGSGYPAGKRKEDTHVYARIINVVDTYAAMVSPRAHRLPYLPYDAMRIVMDDGAKGMLDWELVNAFIRAMSIYPVGSYVRLEGGEIARVVRAQPEIPEKPVIAVVADAQRNMLPAPVEIDLAMTEPMPKITPIAAPA